MALLAAAITAAASFVVVAAPATAAPVSVTDATFEWSVHDTVQYVAGPCHYLSAGRSNGTETTYSATADHVSIVRNGVTPTWADKCTPSAGTGTPINQQVVWSGGTGTVDPATGAAAIAFTGAVTLNMNGGATPIVVTDPVVTVGTDGAATLTATVDGYTQTGVHVPAVTGVVVANMGGVSSANTSGFTASPHFAGVTYDPASGTAQNRAADGWGSWPASWNDAVAPTGNAAFYYTTSTAATQVRKAPNPIIVDYGLQTSSDSQTIGVTVPEVGEPGEFVWSIDGDGQVLMSQAVNHGDHWGSTGAIQPIVVTDDREGAPSWSIAGQVGDFSGGLSGKYLGWTPKVTAAGAGASPGAQVASGFVSGNGLKATSTLASAAAAHAGGTATLGADLDLRLPISTAAGTYSAVLTITALS